MEPHDTNAAQEVNNHILCCKCGVRIESNPSNMCIACLRLCTDMTGCIQKQAIIYFCSICSRYLDLHSASKSITCQLGSKELLHFCLQHLKGLNRLQIVDAEFIWTEPHSKRIKVKITVQDHIYSTNLLRQSFVAEIIVRNQMCQDCKRVQLCNSCNAIVQLRQRNESKQSLFYLEQLIIKHKLHEQIMSVKHVDHGLDFQYASESAARKMLDFIMSVLPSRHQQAKKLISHDTHSNVFDYKYAFCIEIVPITKHSVVCLPKVLAEKLGGINPLCLVYRITKLIHVIDTSTTQTAQISAATFWKHPFNNVCQAEQLVKFVVMDIEETHVPEVQNQESKPYTAVDIWLMKAAEVGKTETFIHTKTHLGHILKHGDTVLGYAISECNINDKYFDCIKEDNIPSVVIVKKYYN